MELTQEIVRELLDYDPETGKLFWKYREPKWFRDDTRWTAEQSCKRWNANWAGKKAGITNPSGTHGYRHVGILGKNYLIHRVVWLYMMGEWPNVIDHVNGDRCDNRFRNLSNGSARDNSRNMKRSSANTSGHTGVSWVKTSSKWRVHITANYKTSWLGLYDSLEEAVAVRKEAEKQLGFHENCGRY